MTFSKRLVRRVHKAKTEYEQKERLEGLCRH